MPCSLPVLSLSKDLREQEKISLHGLPILPDTG
jgi:hypothetical protein